MLLPNWHFSVSSEIRWYTACTCSITNLKVNVGGVPASSNIWQPTLTSFKAYVSYFKWNIALESSMSHSLPRDALNTGCHATQDAAERNQLEWHRRLLISAVHNDINNPEKHHSHFS